MRHVGASPMYEPFDRNSRCVSALIKSGALLLVLITVAGCIGDPTVEDGAEVARASTPPQPDPFECPKQNFFGTWCGGEGLNNEQRSGTKDYLYYCDHDRNSYPVMKCPGRCYPQGGDVPDTCLDPTETTE